MKSVIGVLFLVSAVVGQGLDAATLALIDKNNDGFLDRSEIPGMADLDDTQWAQLKNLMDTNHDGKISISEYVASVVDQQAAQGNPTRLMEQAMHALDLNRDGILNRSEIPGMDQVDDSQWAQMENLVDKNHDGQISIQEYVAITRDQQAAQGNPTKQIEQGLHRLDLNNDGILDQNEVPGNIPNNVWNAMVTVADYNCDGRISIDEYIAFEDRQSQARRGVQGGRHEPPNCQQEVQGDTVLPECHNSTQGLAQMDRSTAERAVRAAIAKSEELDVAVTIAVVDSGANLVSLVRMDGAWLGSVDIAIKKAKTAAMFNMPTRDLEGMSQPGGPLYNVENANDGGIPVRSREGRLLGAVGVAGSTEVYKDEEVVEAAVNASA